MTFSEHVVKAMGQLNLTDLEVAEEFDVSVPTVIRWKAGTTAPHPAMQPYVFEWLEQKGYKQ